MTQTQRLLRRLDVHARKALGQHFLVDEGVLDVIVSAARLSRQDIVVEVGPGLGLLTRELATRAGWVVAIELDDRLAALLKQSLSTYGNVTIIHQDVLRVAPETMLSEVKLEKASGSYKVVANLPYYITSPILRHFLEASVKPELMVVMVQKEVAEEIVAKPGRMSLLSIGVQFYGEPEIVSYVPAESFHPAPEVDSAVLKVTPYLQPAVEIADGEGFFSLVRAGFSAARKQLANSLAQGLNIGKAEVLALLERAKIEPQRRAETLSITEWARLWRTYAHVEQ